jgi:nucleoside-diphosphate-sugar epimerase
LERKKAFVTGATGFLGANLVRELIAQGWEVTAFHRASSDLWRLKGLPLNLKAGSFAQTETLLSAIPDGTDAVFHVAARVSFWRGDDALMEQDNVQATKNLLAASLQRKARRFIHTSSVAVYGLPESRVDESFPQEGLKSHNGYFRTKAQAEVEVRRAIQQGLDAVILNPSNIIGPYDREHWGRSLMRVKEGKMPGAPPGAGSFVHSVEAAKAHVAAFEKGKKGENYILAGTDATYVEIFRTIEEIMGLPPKVKPIPMTLLQLYAWVSQILSSLTGKRPEITPEIITLLTSKVFCDSRKAEAELGFKPRPIKEMLIDCLASLDSSHH